MFKNVKKWFKISTRFIQFEKHFWFGRDCWKEYSQETKDDDTRYIKRSWIQFYRKLSLDHNFKQRSKCWFMWLRAIKVRQMGHSTFWAGISRLSSKLMVSITRSLEMFGVAGGFSTLGGTVPPNVWPVPANAMKFERGFDTIPPWVGPAVSKLGFFTVTVELPSLETGPVEPFKLFPLIVVGFGAVWLAPFLLLVPAVGELLKNPLMSCTPGEESSFGFLGLLDLLDWLEFPEISFFFFTPKFSGSLILIKDPLHVAWCWLHQVSLGPGTRFIDLFTSP